MPTATRSRDLQASDAETLAALSRRLGGDETVEQWQALLERPGAVAVGAVVDGRIVGSAAGEIRGGFGMPGPVAWLEAFGIEVERRGGAIGRALLADFLEFEEKMWLYDRIQDEVETFVESMLFAEAVS